MWKDCPKYEQHFEISVYGELKSKKSGRILKTHENKRGYHVYISRGKRVRIHRAVALAFIPNPDNLPVVNHKNTDKSDNFEGNLEWVTFSDNTKHAHASGCFKK